MSDFVRNSGHLRIKEQEAKGLKLRLAGDIEALNAMLDPFAPLEDMKAEVVAAQAVEMAGKHAEYLGLLAEIKTLKQALGK